MSLCLCGRVRRMLKKCKAKVSVCECLHYTELAQRDALENFCGKTLYTTEWTTMKSSPMYGLHVLKVHGQNLDVALGCWVVRFRAVITEDSVQYIYKVYPDKQFKEQFELIEEEEETTGTPTPASLLSTQQAKGVAALLKKVTK